MSRMTCYLLACTMALATVMAINPGPSALQQGIGYQCRSRGNNYVGACIRQNEFNGELTCLSLACAVRDVLGNYLAVPTGPVDDGTLCGLNKVCKRGVCVSQTPTDIVFPVGNDPRYYCLVAPVATISGYPPGSNPERNRPAIEIPSVKDGHTVRMQIPSPGAIHRSRPMPSTSTSGQRSAPAASTSTGTQTSRFAPYTYERRH